MSRGILVESNAGGARMVRGGVETFVVKMPAIFAKNEPAYFWHDKGLIKWEHCPDPNQLNPKHDHGTMLWEDFAKNVLSLSEMLTRSGEENDYADERLALQRVICDCEQIIRQAKDYGSPLQRGLIEHVPEARKKYAPVKYDPHMVEF